MADFDPIASGQDIGEGWAQVFKPYEDDTYIKALEAGVKKKEKKEEEGKARQKSIMEGLSGIKKLDILPDDQPGFAKKQAEIYKYTSDNIDDLMKGNPAKTIEFNRLLTQIANDAAHSKNYRENHEKLGVILATHPDIYTPEAKEAWRTDGTSSFDDKGGYKNIDITRYDKKIKPVNLNDFFDKYYRKLVDKQKRTYTIQEKKGGYINSTNYQLKTEDDLRKLFDSVMAGATDDVKEKINADYLTDKDDAKPSNSADWAWKKFGAPFVQEVIGKGIKKLPQERIFGDRTRYTDGGKEPKDYQVTSGDIYHWNKAYNLKTGALDPDNPIQSTTPSFSANLPGKKRVMFKASKLYNPLNYWEVEKNGEVVDDPNQVGTYIPMQINEALDFQDVTYMPYEPTTKRFLTKEEYESGKHKNGKPFTKTYMAPIIPVSWQGKSHFLDAEEKDVATTAGQQFPGGKLPKWYEVYDKLPDDVKATVPKRFRDQADRERPAETEEKGKTEAKQKGGGGTPPPAGAGSKAPKGGSKKSR